jgi:hypothetical protein
MPFITSYCCDKLSPEICTHGDTHMTDEPAPIEKDRIVREEDESVVEAALGNFLQAKLDEGWSRKDGIWRHPTVRNKWMLIDPMSGEVTFSAKFIDDLEADADAVSYVEVIREHGQRQQAEGGQ